MGKNMVCEHIRKGTGQVNSVLLNGGTLNFATVLYVFILSFPQLLQLLRKALISHRSRWWNTITLIFR